ncbi:neurofilament medium polypeptide-like [Bactrocera dorsalis]|uniref:Neurofilament medium polypeptide-like n=1 Tax=Bactrocera dorsalis TaxID=27457 RepID=A0ABM3IYA4_BACDO|nr:neurofilament medium polypeptide-like [Bactrocera dorsalis]
MSDKKVKRERPNKKWTKEEINKLLDFLEEADEIEAPTAQFFYKKCIVVKGIEATWDLLRWKVRHLKSTFKKAHDYRTSTGAGIDEMDVGVGSFEEKIEKMCPHYHRLNKIFGAKSHAQNNFCAVDTGNDLLLIAPQPSTISPSTISPPAYSPPIVFPPAISPPIASPPAISPLIISSPAISPQIASPSAISPQIASPPAISPLIISTPAISPQIASPSAISPPIASPPAVPPPTVSQQPLPLGADFPQSVKTMAKKMKMQAPKTSAACLMVYQQNRTELEKEKLLFEKEKLEKHLELSKAEIELKKEELKLKKIKLEQDEKIRRLEIEIDERIAMYEIKMKYTK